MTEKAKRSSSLHRLLLVGLGLLLLPVTASAHSMVSGTGYFAGGMLHLLTTPTHLLVLLSLSLLAGQHSPLDLKTPLSAFIPVSALALLLSTTGVVKTVYPAVLIAVALAAGILVALEKPLPAMAYRMLFAVAALAIGLDSGVETGTWGAIAKTLLGTWTALIFVVGDVAYYISLVGKKQWQKVGLRVAGSWITAASLMILAFALRR
jgi:urease accessory protein